MTQPIDPASTDDVVAMLKNRLTCFSFSIRDERAFQDGIATVLRMSSIEHRREVAYGAGDRFDFLCAGGVVIEAKIKGSAAAAIQQASRYLAHDDVKAVVIVATRHWALDEKIKSLHSRGKRIHVVCVRGPAF